MDDFFEAEKSFLLEYHTRLRDATIRADKMTVLHKQLADNYIKISAGLDGLAANGSVKKDEEGELTEEQKVEQAANATEVMI